MLFVLGVIRGDDDDRSLDLLAFIYRSGSITLRRISVPCPLPLAPFRSVATDDDDRFSAARSRGSMLSRRESRRGASEGEGVESRSTKTTQHAAAWGLQASLEVESWSVVSKRSYLDIPIIFHLDTRRFIFISSFHHHQFDRSVFGYSG
jgi:hypothetical protein